MDIFIPNVAQGLNLKIDQPICETDRHIFPTICATCLLYDWNTHIQTPPPSLLLSLTKSILVIGSAAATQ